MKLHEEDEAPPEEDFSLRIVMEACVPLLLVCVVFFVVIIAYLAATLPESVRFPLLTQKFIYLAILISLYRALRQGRVPVRWANSLVTLILGLCLSSVMLTQAFGIPSAFNEKVMTLFLGSALLDVFPAWAIFHWACLWAAWIWMAAPVYSEPEFLSHLVHLVGFQLLALGAFLLRQRSARAQLEMLQNVTRQGRLLAGALQSSENLRNVLDQNVEKRTVQLQLAYEELRLSLTEREKISAERERLQEQLLQSQKMESLGRLAGGIAHDFNNLLTVVLGNLEFALGRRPLEQDLEENLTEAQTAAQRAADVTGQLLAFSRKQVMKVDQVNLHDLLEDSLKLMKRLLGEDICLDVDYGPHHLIVAADPTQIRQVVMNLVLNARDAMPSGGNLVVSLHRVEDWAVLRVRDTGCGIEPALHGKIFEPFFTTKPKGEGSGLGLSTILGIVSQHKGRVEFKSTPSRGSTFEVFLPTDGLAAGTVPFAKAPSKPLTGPLPRRGTILLVEDDEQVRKFASQVLKGSGYAVVQAENGDAALELVKRDLPQFDLLVTDVIMPGMDGAQLALSLREMTPELPVLFMSGYTDDKLVQVGIERGEGNFLSKPFTVAGLLSAVREALPEPKSLVSACNPVNGS